MEGLKLKVTTNGEGYIEGSRRTDWDFDFSSLSRRSVRDAIPYVYDKFYHILGRDALFCIYSIAEVGMLDYRGFLAILTNREHPELILDISEGVNFYEGLWQDPSGELVFMRAHTHNKTENRSSDVILVFDVALKRVAASPIDSAEIDLRSLEWYDFCKIGSLIEKL